MEVFEKWNIRAASENSWVVPAEEIVKHGYDLTAKNPNQKDDYEHRTPEELVAGGLEKEHTITKILEDLQGLLGGQSGTQD